MGGGPLVFSEEIVSLAITSTAIVLLFIKAISRIIVEFLKSLGNKSVKIKKGDLEIEIKGEKDIEKALDLLRRLEE